MNHRQVARFQLSERIIRHDPDYVAEIFAILNAVVIQAEPLFDTMKIKYTAISERFTEVTFGEVPPEVDLLVETDCSGHVSLVEVVYQ